MSDLSEGEKTLRLRKLSIEFGVKVEAIADGDVDTTLAFDNLNLKKWEKKIIWVLHIVSLNGDATSYYPLLQSEDPNVYVESEKASYNLSELKYNDLLSQV